MHNEAKKAQSWSLEQRRFYCRTIKEDQVVHALKNPELLKGFQQSAFIFFFLILFYF